MKEAIEFLKENKKVAFITYLKVCDFRLSAFLCISFFCLNFALQKRK